MNAEIKLVHSKALEFAAKLNMINLKWDCDRLNDYFALYDDEYTLVFSYGELLSGKCTSATTVIKF